jgi:streptogrisin C
MASAKMPESVAQALDKAMRASEASPKTLSYPFVDQETKKIVVTGVTATSARGAVTANQKRSPQASFVAKTVPNSRQHLDLVMDKVIGRQPEGVTVIASYPDPQNNRIIAEMATLNDSFLFRVADQYGANSVAIRLVKDGNAGGPAASREADNSGGSGFYGGAHVDPPGCTTGFSWHSGTDQMMVTAGHCFSTGGSARTPVESMGSVQACRDENWLAGTGTRYLCNQTTHRGDLALIRLSSGKSSGPYIYRGGFNSSSFSPVAGKWGRSPASGDRYCTGGRVSGEQCGWEVKWSAAGNYTYTVNDEVARHVWRGEKRGHCIEAGDSGGPVYTVDSSGRVLAKGIISGATGFGGSDHNAGALERACRNIFTDIWDAYFGFPGDIN